jgi:hypothetical protein
VMDLPTRLSEELAASVSQHVCRSDVRAPCEAGR